MITTAIRMDMVATNAIQGWNFSFLLMGASGCKKNPIVQGVLLPFGIFPQRLRRVPRSLEIGVTPITGFDQQYVY